MSKLLVDYREQILPELRESFLPAQYTLCARLIELCSRRSLSDRHRSELIKWIMEVLDDIHAMKPETSEFLAKQFRSAYAHSQRMSEEEMDQLMAEQRKKIDQAMSEAESQYGAEPPDLEQTLAEAEAARAEEIKREVEARQAQNNGDLFGFDDLDDIIETAKEEAREQASESFQKQYRNAEQFWEQLEDDLAAASERLPPKMDSQWLKNLFRRAARALHPDREPDPEQQKIKTSAMSELLNARDNQDVATIIELYAEYVSDTDLQMTDSEADSIIELLNHQLESLILAREQLVNQTPLHTELYEALYAISSKKRAAKRKQYLREFRNEAKEAFRTCERLRNLDQLRAELDIRYELIWEANPFNMANYKYD